MAPTFKKVEKKGEGLVLMRPRLVPSCKYCNKAKLTMTQSEFFDLVKRIYERHINVKT